MKQHRGQAVPQVQSTLAKLSLCRTWKLGGRLHECESCGHRQTRYNSCGDRHCPTCSGSKRADWLDSTAGLLLPKVDYFQVVFTIPDKLSSLALGNRQVMYNLLFQSAWRALKHVVEGEQGFEAAAVMVLHTWNQKLEPHAHVHALVPGGGPSLRDPNVWVTSRCRSGKRHDGPFLADAKDLRRTFRDAFLRGLKRLHARDELKLDGDWSHLQDAGALKDYLEPLERVDWVTFIEPPPENSRPEHVVKYLARYMTGGPISDRRLISHDEDTVTFYARSGTKMPGGQLSPSSLYELTGIEFTRCWSMHILPKGFTKTRRFGGYSNRHRQRYVAKCLSLLKAIVREDLPNPTVEPTSEETEVIRCTNCNHVAQLIVEEPRPSWRAVMTGEHRPRWYEHG